LASIRDLYDFDPTDGIIVNKRFGLRSFVLGVREWDSLIEMAYNTLGSAAQVILFGAGKEYGRTLLEKEKETIDSNSELKLNLLSREATLAGWGKITIAKESDQYYTLKAQRCVFCSGLGDTGHKEVGCFFLRGVISGFAEALLSASCSVEETHAEETIANSTCQ
jgi:predicted hydrocarbon binding protein